MSGLIGKEGGGSEVETFGCYVGVLSGCQWHRDPAEPVVALDKHSDLL